jgi:hypothetical protein
MPCISAIYIARQLAPVRHVIGKGLLGRGLLGCAVIG